MSEEASPRATAASIAGGLRAAIARGDYAPGDRLPGENVLMSEHGVARMTARHALGILQAEGLTVTRRGVGVFVREFRPIIRNSIGRVSSREWRAGRSIWESDTEGRTLTVDIVEVVPRVIPPPDVRSILRLGARGKATVRRRRYLLDGKPVLVATSYLPTSLVADSAITQQDTGPGGTYARLAELGFAPAYFREDVTARMPTADESEALRIPPGTPVLDITRTAVTSDGEPVEVNRMTLDAAAYVVRYDFDA